MERTDYTVSAADIELIANVEAFDESRLVLLLVTLGARMLEPEHALSKLPLSAAMYAIEDAEPAIVLANSNDIAALTRNGIERLLCKAVRHMESRRPVYGAPEEDAV